MAYRFTRIATNSGSYLRYSSPVVANVPFTIAGWFLRVSPLLTTGGMAVATLAGNVSTRLAGSVINCLGTDDQFSARINTSGLLYQSYAANASTESTTTWGLIIATFDSDGTGGVCKTRRSYFGLHGGSLVTSSSNSTAEQDVTGLFTKTLIGANAANSDGNVDRFDGYLSHVAMWNSVLDATARTALLTYTPDYSGSIPTPVAYWPLDANHVSGRDGFNDSIGSAHMTAGDTDPTWEGGVATPSLTGPAASAGAAANILTRSRPFTFSPR